MSPERPRTGFLLSFLFFSVDDRNASSNTFALSAWRIRFYLLIFSFVAPTLFLGSSRAFSARRFREFRSQRRTRLVSPPNIFPRLRKMAYQDHHRFERSLSVSSRASRAKRHFCSTLGLKTTGFASCPIDSSAIPSPCSCSPYTPSRRFPTPLSTHPQS